jgi:hypothetical protein
LLEISEHLNVTELCGEPSLDYPVIWCRARERCGGSAG